MSSYIWPPFGPSLISLVDRIPPVFMSYTNNSRHFLIEYYSTPWAIRWEGCRHYKGLSLHYAESRCNLGPREHKRRSVPPRRFALRSPRSYIVATALCPRALSSWRHP